MMKIFRRISIILNFRALLIAVLAVLATYVCRTYQITADFPLTLVATAVVFPIVFSIGGAYKRREDALNHYGSLKAHGRAIYFAARDWPETIDETSLQELKGHLFRLMEALRRLFTGSLAAMVENEIQVQEAFSCLSKYIRSLRKLGLASGEISRCNQYLSKMMLAFESVKHIYQYRTPRTLRTFSEFFIVVLPIAYGPYFSAVSGSLHGVLAYVTPVLFTIILVSLDTIQDHLENPFDQIGEDDVMINAEKFIAHLEMPCSRGLAP